MTKDNLKLVSARIDPDTLTKIEQFCSKHTYWKRNSVINNILTTVMNDFDDRMKYDMVRRTFFRDQSINANYEIVRDGGRLYEDSRKA